MNVMPSISCTQDEDCYESIAAKYWNFNEDIRRNKSIYMVDKYYLIKPPPSYIQIGCYLESTRCFVGICI